MRNDDNGAWWLARERYEAGKWRPYCEQDWPERLQDGTDNPKEQDNETEDLSDTSASGDPIPHRQGLVEV
jgi:hypothetical protein